MQTAEFMFQVYSSVLQTVHQSNAENHARQAGTLGPTPTVAYTWGSGLNGQWHGANLGGATRPSDDLSFTIIKYCNFFHIGKERRIHYLSLR